MNVVVVNGLADLLPASFSGDDMSIDIEEFVRRYRQWLKIHQNRFANNAESLAAVKYVLSETALQWLNDIPAANMPATLNDLHCNIFVKFRITKTRQEWKKELEQCNYVPGTINQPMINKFQLFCGKLQWPLPVQIEMFVRILPMNLRTFVVSRAHLNFTEGAESVKTYHELIEVDTVSHIFNNISFADVDCSLCHKPHKSLECPSLHSIIEMEVSSTITPTDYSLSSSDSL